MPLTQEELNLVNEGYVTDPKPANEASSESRLNQEQLEQLARKSSFGGQGVVHLNPEDFDFNLKSGDFDNLKFRAQDQSWGEQLLKGVGAGIAKIPFEVVGSAASILDFEDYINQDNEVGNAITRAMNEAKQNIDEALPIYRENPGATLDVGDFAWWASNGSNLLTSAAAFAITGMGVGALASKGTQALKWAALAAKTGKSGVQAAQVTGSFLSTGTTALALNQAEGMLSAIDIYDETYKRSIELGYIDDEAKNIAASSAAHSIKVNRANILLNLTSSSAFTRGFRPAFARNILKREALGKIMLAEGAQEYGEEVINLFAEQQGKREADLALRGGDPSTLTSEGKNIIDTFFSLEGLEAGLLGAVGGIAQTGFTHLGKRYSPEGKYRAAELERRIKQQQTSIQNLDAVWGKEGFRNLTTALTGLKETGTIIQERDALMVQVDEHVAKGETVPTQLEAQVDIKNEEILAIQAFYAFEQGTTEHLEAQYKEIETLTPEEALKKGFTSEQLNEKSPNFYKKIGKKAVENIAKYEKIYNSHYGFRNMPDIYNNRRAKLNVETALASAQEGVALNFTVAGEVNNTLPLYGNDSRPNISEFQFLSSKGNKQQKTYITNARKKSAIKAYEESLNRSIRLAENLKEFDIRYKNLTSLTEQRRLAKLEKDRIRGEKEAKKSKEVADKAKQDVAKIQDDVADLHQNKDNPDAEVNIEVRKNNNSKEGSTEVGLENAPVPETTLEEVDPEVAAMQKSVKELQLQKDKEEKAKLGLTEEVIKDLVGQKKLGDNQDHQITDQAETQQIQTKLQDDLDIADNKLSKAFSLGYRQVEVGSDEGVLNPEVNTDLLDYNKVNEGTEVTLVVDETYDGLVYDIFGDRVPWQEYKNSLTGEALIEKTPIAVMKDGEKIAYIHETGWFNEENTKHSDFSVEDEQARSRAVRKAIIDAGEVKTTINYRSNGLLIQGSQIQPLATGMPGAKIAIIRNGAIEGYNDLDIYNREEITSNKQKKEGFTLAIVPVNKNIDGKTVYMALPMMRQKVGQEAIMSIYKATEILMENLYGNTTEEHERIAKEIQDTIGLNILKPHDLGEYIRLFTHNTVPEGGDGPTSLTAYMVSQPQEKNVISSSTNGVAFGNGGQSIAGENKRIIIPIIYEKDKQTYLDNLYAHLSKLYTHVEGARINNKISVPVISEKGEVTTLFSGQYQDYASKYNLQTNLLSHEIGTEEAPNRVYTMQATVNFNAEFAGMVLPVNQSEEIQQTQDNDGPTTELSVQPANIDMTKVKGVPGQSLLDKYNMDSFLKGDKDISKDNDLISAMPDTPITSPYILDGFTVEQQILLIDNLVADAIAAEDENKDRTIQQVLNQTADELAAKDSRLKAQKWKIKELFRLRLQRYLDVIIQSEDEFQEATEPQDEQQSIQEKDSVWGEDILTVNPKSKISHRLKRVLGFTPDANFDGSTKITNDGFVVYVDEDKAYNTMTNLLSENYSKPDRTEAKFSEMMKVLEGYRDVYPFLPNLVQRLKNAPRQIQNEFVVVANKHYVQMNFVVTGKTDKGTYFNIWEDNANSRNQVVLSLWKDNNLFNAPIAAGNDLSPNLDIRDELITEYEKWLEADEYSIEDVKLWLSKLGITVTKNTLEAFMDIENPVMGIDFKKHFNPKVKGGVFGNLYKQLAMLTEGVNLHETSLYGKTAIKVLASVEARNNAMFISNSHRSGNKTIYSHSNHKFASQRSADLLYDVKVLTELANNPATKYSSWLRQLLKTEKVDLNPDIEADDGVRYIRDPQTGDVIINKDSYFHNNFNFGYIGQAALKEIDTFFNKDSKLSNLSEADHEQVKMGFFQNKGTQSDGTRLARYFFPTMSDKSAMFTTVATATTIDMDATGELEESVIDNVFQTVLLPEIMRMSDTEAAEKSNILNYYKNAKGELTNAITMFYSMPELNDIPELWHTAEDELGESSVRTFKMEAAISGSKLHQTLKKGIRQHLDNLIAEQITTWEEFDIYDVARGTIKLDSAYDAAIIKNNIIQQENKEATDKFKAKLAAADFSINYLIANSNYVQLYTSDIAQYFDAPKDIKPGEDGYYTAAAKSTFDNMGKRLAGLSGPGYNIPILAGESSVYRQGFLKDRTASSLASDYLDRLWGKKSEQAKKYRNIKKSTDAQELITVKERLKTLYSTGQISYADYKNLTGKEFYTPKDLKKLKVFQAEKPLYVGAVYSDSPIERKLYIKSSAIVLLPQFTKGLEIDKLRVMMEKQSIDRVAFDSAVKVGNVEDSLNIWNEDGTINEEVSFGPLQMLELNRADFRIQQDVPVKESEVVKRVSQASKLAFVNILNTKGFKLPTEEGSLTGKELRERYLNSWETLYRSSRDELMEELGINMEDETWKPDPVKLQKILREEAEKRDYALQDIEGLNLLEDGSFELPLWIQGGGAQFESLLSSLVANKVLDQEMPGKTYVLASEEGIMSQEKAEDEFGSLAQTGIIFTNNFNAQLQPANPDRGSMNNQVLVPWPFKGVPIENFIGENGRLDLSNIEPSLLERYGMRIPNQGPSSNGNIEVVGFLPEAMGDIIIAPRDFLVQMGSDFDLDKLFTYAYNYVTGPDGSLNRVSEASVNIITIQTRIDKLESQINENLLLDAIDDKTGIISSLKAEQKNLKRFLEPNAIAKMEAQDSIVDIHRSINANPNEEIQKQIREPLDIDELRGYAEKIEASMDTGDFFSPLSSNYQRIKFKNASASKDAVGIFANANTFNALSQAATIDAGALVIHIDKAHEHTLKVAFGEQKSEGNLSRTKTLDDSQYIAFNISSFLSAAVDNEREQVLHKVNANNLTFGVLNLLNQLGFTQDVVTSFLSQPILFDLVKKVEHNKSKGMVEKVAFEKAIETLEKEKYYIAPLEGTDENSTSDIIKSFKNIGSKRLFQAIDKGSSGKDFIPIQRAMLDKFKFLYEQSDSLRNLQLANNVDSSGTGKNLIESKAKEDNIARVIGDSKISNSASLFGEVKHLEYESTVDERLEEDPSWIKLGKTYIRPKTLSGFATMYGVVPNNKMWNQPAYFPYTDQSVKDTMALVKNMSNRVEFNESSNAEIDKQIFNGIKSYLLSDMNKLGFIQDTEASDSGRLARLALLSGNNNLQKLISENRYTQFFRDNAFLNKLTVKKRKGTIGSLKFDHKIENSQGKLNVYMALIELLNSTEKLPDRIINRGTKKEKKIPTQLIKEGVSITTKRELAQALIASQYASGGIQKYTQFLRFIPLDYLKKIGFTSQVRNVDFASLLTDGQGPKDQFGVPKQVPYFVAQFFQHNPHLLPQIEKEDMLDADSVDISKIKTFKVQQAFSARNKPIPAKRMVSIKHKNGTYGIYLFDNNKYIRLDKLGAVDYNEYQKGEMTRTTVFNNLSSKTNNDYADQKAANSTQNNELIIDESNKTKLNEKYKLQGKDVEPSITDTLNVIADFAYDKGHKELARQYRDILEASGLDYKLVVDSSMLAAGRHSSEERTIFINPSKMASTDTAYTKTMLHEITHMLANEVLDNPVTEEQKAAKTSLNRLFKSYQKTLKSGELQSFNDRLKTRRYGLPVNITQDEISRIYPATSLKEFVAGFMTDSKTQQYFNSIKFSEELSYGQEYEKRLLKLLKSKGVEETSAVAQAISDVITIIEPVERNTMRGVVATSSKSTSNNIDSITEPKTKGDRFVPNITIGDSKGLSNAALDRAAAKFEAGMQADKEAAIDDNPIPTAPISTEAPTTETSSPPINEPPTGLSMTPANIDMSEVRFPDKDDLPAATTDTLIEKAKKEPKISMHHPSINMKRKVVNDIYKQIARLRTKINKVEKEGNIKLVVALNDLIEAKEQRIKEIGEEIDNLDRKLILDDSIDLAKQDMIYAKSLLQGDNTAPEDLVIAERIIDQWKDFVNSDYYKEAPTSEARGKSFKEFKNKARDLEDLMYDIRIAKTKEYVKKELKDKVKPSDIEKMLDTVEDVGFGKSYTLDLSKTKLILLQAISQSIQKATNGISEDLAIMSEELAPLLAKAEKALENIGYSGINKWDIFKQRDAKGRATSRVVTAYSTKYYKDKAKLESALKKGNKIASRDYNDWRESHNIVINPANLDKDKLVAEIGLEGFKQVKKEADAKYEQYQRALEIITYEVENSPELSTKEKQNAILNWKMQFDPATHDISKRKLDTSGNPIFVKDTYLVLVPRKRSTDGKDTGYHDANFEIIQQNEDLRNFHTYLLSTLNDLRNYIPGKKGPMNSIPLIQKTFMETFKEKGGMAVLNKFGEAVTKSVRGNSEGRSVIVDDLTEGRTLNSNFNRNIEKKIADKLDFRRIQYKQEKGVEATIKVENTWRAEVIDEITEESSFDLGEILKAYAGTAIAYKHKSQIETSLRIAEQTFAEVREGKEGANGKLLRDDDGNISSKEGLKQYKAMLESTLNKFFGVKEDAAAQVGNKIYTKAEKATKAELEEMLITSEEKIKTLDTKLDSGEIKEDVYKKEKEKEEADQIIIEKQLNKLGGRLSGSRAIEGAQRMTQVLGMGWNAIAGAANFGFGQIANIISGAGGQYYTNTEYFKALQKALHSISSVTGAKTPTAKKISVLMRRWDILKKSSQELFKQKTSSNKILNVINPYKIQDSTEFMNQAPIMIAMQEKTPVLNSKGEQIVIDGQGINFWNAYDSDGNWRTDLGVNEEAVLEQKAELKLIINSVVRENHGNYDSQGASIRIKDSVVGRLLAQFRSWMFEGYATRFEGEYEDVITGKIKKGRYRTLASQGLGVKLLKAGAWQNLSAIDKINMKKSFMEASILLGMLTTIALLKGSLEDEDDERKLSYMNTLVNLSLRMQTDILFYISPSDFEHLTKSTIPAASLITKTSSLVSSMYGYIMGEDEITSGIYAGESRLWRNFTKMSPGLSSYRKIKDTSKQIFEK